MVNFNNIVDKKKWLLAERVRKEVNFKWWYMIVDGNLLASTETRQALLDLASDLQEDCDIEIRRKRFDV